MNYRIHHLRLAGLVAAALLAPFSACDGGASTTVASDSDYDQVATTMGALMAEPQHGELAAVDDATVIAQGDMPTSFVLSGDLAIGQRFGLDFSYAVVCRDIDDQVVACSDDAATDAHVKASWKGHWSSPTLDGSAELKADWRLADLDQAVLVLDGTTHAKADLKVESSDGATSSHSKIEYDATYHDVGITADEHLAVSGSATYVVDYQRNVDSGDTTSKLAVKVHAVVTFTADHAATLTLDGAHVYLVDLIDGSVEPMTNVPG